ncbi:MAG: hypothetical protein ACLFTU_10245 [Puniceicoccaceae bacterium]
MTLSAFIDRLAETRTPHAVLRHPRGGAAVFLPAAARLIGLWPDPEGPNLLWTHPQLPDRPDAAAEGWGGMAPGGPGGDRLWQGPEHRYFWEGTPQSDLSNWRVPPAWDPGTFAMTATGVELRFERNLELPDGATATVERHFRLEATAEPGHLRLRETQALELHGARDDTQLDLWVITQVPAGSRLVVPTRGDAEPGIAYENRPGDIARLRQSHPGGFVWDVTGEPMLKGHLSASQVRGVLGCLKRWEGDGASLLLRHFTPRPEDAYLDGLLPEQVGTQCVQFWDGLGYGEIECHSPTATAAAPRIEQTYRLDARIGSAAALSAIASEALGAEPVESFLKPIPS